MKKLILQMLFILILSPAIAQTTITVTGTLTDQQTGNPIPNYPVTILSDSTQGWFFYTTVYTNSNGYYSDSLWSPSSTGTLFIQVWDCNQALHQDTCNFSSGSYIFTKDFSICYTVAPCNADFTYQQSGYQTIAFTDQSSGSPVYWNWSFGDGNSSTLENPVHTYASNGYYQVMLYIHNSGSLCADSIIKMVAVMDSTPGCQAAFYAVPDSNASMSYQFTDQSTGNISSWSWNFGDPASGMNNNSSVQNPSHVYSQPGIYVTCLTIQGVDSSCYSTTCDTLFVGTGPGCQAQFTYYADSMQGGLPVIHFIDLSYGTPTSWLWDFGDGTPTVQDQNPVHIYAQAGTYYVCLTIQCQGTTSTWCANVNVNGTNGCESYFTYSAVSLTVAYEGHMVNGFPATYEWGFGDGTTGAGQNQTHTYTAAGIYYVTLTTADTTGCTYSTGQSVVVGDSTNFNQVYGQVYAGNFPAGPGTTMISSIDSSAGFNPFISYSALDSNGVYYFTMVPSGHYVIYAIPYDSAGYLPTYYGDVLTWQQATVLNLGQPNNPYDIHLIPSGDLIPGIGTITGLINSGDFATGTVDKIKMILMNENKDAISFGNVNAAGEFNFPSLDYGAYYLHPELAGCSSDLVKVFISPVYPHPTVNMTFTGGKILGVENHTTTLEAGVVYPNPVISEANVTVTLKTGSRITIELFNLMGQAVYQDSRTLGQGSTQVQIPVSDLPTGIYSLRITSNQGETMSRKLLKSK
jgi:PKD repeat protein